MFLLNKQEVFDKIVTSLRRQGKKSQNDNGLCLYRGEDNCKCAIGHIIPDELYRPAMESWGIDSPLVYNALRITVEVNAFNIVSLMQGIHDKVDVDQWEKHFKLVATNHNLIYV